MDAPESFTRRLQAEFPDLRLRWAETKGEWHIEQHIGRGLFDPPLVSTNLPVWKQREQHERRERARSGYAYVMAIRPGTRMPCPVDGSTLRVPVMETREVRCAVCKAAGRDGRYAAAYFPLGELLMDHLRRIDPRRGAARILAQEADKANERAQAARERERANLGEAALKDAYARIAGIESVGYTGRELV